MSSALLDTRTAFKSERTHLSTFDSESLIGSAELTFFRRLVHELLLLQQHILQMSSTQGFDSLRVNPIRRR